MSTRHRHFSFRRVLFCMLPLFGLALWILALGSLANAGATATAEQPARVSVPVPAAAKTANIVMLELGVAVVRKPSSGQLGAVVRLRERGGKTVEIGRVSLLGGEQSYQFNVGALSGGSAEVEVSLIDRGGGSVPAGVELSISRAHIVTR